MTEKEILKLVGARIRALRKEQGLSQEALGEKGGFHFSYIGQIERGEKNISLQSLAKVASALEVSVVQLFAYAYEEGELMDIDINDIMMMLKRSSPEKVRIAKNVIREIVRD
ncbi:HTH-type transcriptional regulator SinR [compost metagenome]